MAERGGPVDGREEDEPADRRERSNPLKAERWYQLMAEHQLVSPLSNTVATP